MHVAARARQQRLEAGRRVYATSVTVSERRQLIAALRVHRANDMPRKLLVEPALDTPCNTPAGRVQALWRLYRHGQRASSFARLSRALPALVCRKARPELRGRAAQAWRPCLASA